MSAVAGPVGRAAATRRFVLEPRAGTSLPARLGVAGGSILGALLTGAVLLGATGHDPVTVYRTMVDASFGSPLAFSQTLTQTTPILLTALGVALAYRLRLYTIGADGQLLVGAVVASGVALELTGLPGPLLIVVSLAGGVAGGAAWAAIAGALRAWLRTDEVISTLMLNFIAVYLINLLVIDTHSIWRDPASPTQAQGAPLPDAVALPKLFEQADVGIVIALLAALGLALLLPRTRWGFEVRVIGDTPRAGRYAGMRVARKIVAVMALSGALAGLAGAIQVTSVTQALDLGGLSPGLGYGYTGIVVAALARLSFAACAPVALLMAALLSAGPALELAQIPEAVVLVLQGVLLLLVAAGQLLLDYRIRRIKEPEA